MVLNWYIEEAGTKIVSFTIFFFIEHVECKELIYINVYVLFCIKQQQFVEGLRG